MFIERDLTPLRAEVLRELKADPNRISVWTVDGRMFCIQNDGGRNVEKAIESSEDLLSVELSDAKIKESGFYVDLWDRHDPSVETDNHPQMNVTLDQITGQCGTCIKIKRV